MWIALNGLTVPVCGSQISPPLQPPSRQEFGPGLVLKSQLRRPLGYVVVSHQPTAIEGDIDTQIRPAAQLSGTEKETEEEARATQLLQIQSGLKQTREET